MSDAVAQLERVERRAIKSQNNLLHPAGGITDAFVYEPLGYGRYVCRSIDGEKGIAKVQVEYEDPKKKRGPSWFLEIYGEKKYFKEKPVDTWLFHIPDIELVESWVKGQKTSRSLKDLWTLSQVYFRTFLDLPKECEYSALTLSVVQSWLTELLNVVFYTGIQGEFGGGKTVTGEAIVLLCRHGYQTGSLSPAFVARSIEKEKVTLFVDELDSIAGTKDSDLYAIFRHGYRRGGTYSRINKDTMKRETYEVFGSKLYSIHASVESALQSRTLPLHIRETENHKYPIVNLEKMEFGKKLHNEFFFWYFDHVFGLRDNTLEFLVDQLDVIDPFGRDEKTTDNEEYIVSKAEETRQRMYKHRIGPLSEGQVKQICQVTGRNVELEYQCLILSNLLGINLDLDIQRLFEQKTIEEGEEREIGFMGTLRDVLTKTWQDKCNNKNYRTESGSVKISNKELYSKFNSALKEEGYSGVSPHKFKEYLTEFGFSDALNRKKMEVPIPGEDEPHSRLCNIFTPRVLRKLDLQIPEPTENEKIVELRQWIQKNKDTDSLIDLAQLANQCKELNIEPQKAIEKLRDEGFLAESPQLGKYVVER